jgi:hypothetical protein
MASIDTLDQHQFSQSNLMDFDLENVIEVSTSFHIVVLLLKANLAIIVELERKKQVIRWLNLQIVALSKGMHVPVLAILILNNPAWIVTKSNQANSVL